MVVVVPEYELHVVNMCKREKGGGLKQFLENFESAQFLYIHSGPVSLTQLTHHAEELIIVATTNSKGVLLL